VSALPSPEFPRLTAGEKIRRHLQAHGMSQAQFSALSQIPTSNLNLIVKGDREPTLTMAMRAAKVMGCTVDDLINPELDYPMPKAEDRPRPLTTAERKVIDLAHDASKWDQKPAQLDTAQRRLLGFPPGPLAPDPLPPLPTREPPAESVGGKRRR
jgi:transcriptional regulator with XRE-family HTH domain